MTREEFERLLSDWLDEPLRADLHDLMESACAQSPELVALRDAWRKSHAITRETPAALQNVDWREQRLGIRSAIDAEIGAVMDPGARELEDLVSLAMPTLGIDWSAQRAQIAARLDEHVAQVLQPGPLDNVLAETDPADVNWRSERTRIAALTTRRLRLRRWTGFAAGISAAAAVVAFFMMRAPVAVTPSADADFGSVVVVDAPQVQPDAGDADAMFAVSAPDGVDLAALDPVEEPEESMDLYFSIEPALTLVAGS
jgi:hypothetical protein